MKTKADECKEEGNKCVKEGNHMAAVIHYTEAIKHDPNSAVLYSNRALAFLKIDQLFLAMEDAQKAIKMEPSWPKGFFRKGEIEFKAGQYEKALKSYKQALILDPSDDGLQAAITRTNKEFSKDKKEAAQKPLLYSCLGLMVGVMIVAADQFLTEKPSIQYTILQLLLVAGCGGVGYATAKIQRFFVISQRQALMEEPTDLLKAMGDDSGDIFGSGGQTSTSSKSDKSQTSPLSQPANKKSSKEQSSKKDK